MKTKHDDKFINLVLNQIPRLGYRIVGVLQSVDGEPPRHEVIFNGSVSTGNVCKDETAGITWTLSATLGAYSMRIYGGDPYFDPRVKVEVSGSTSLDELQEFTRFAVAMMEDFSRLDRRMEELSTQ